MAPTFKQERLCSIANRFDNTFYAHGYNVEIFLSKTICLYHSAAMLSLEENKKLCFCTASLALNSRLAEACRAKTKLSISPRLNMAAE